MKRRTEQQVFNDLTKLCCSRGYAHALAYLCFRDNITGYGDELRGEDLARSFSYDRLVRTEIATLLGLMIRSPLDLSLPTPQQLQSLINESDALLKELHDCLLAPIIESFGAASDCAGINPFKSAAVLREPIFYGSESAYSFQYRDFAPVKYARDARWLEENKGFTADQAQLCVKAISEYLNQNLLATVKQLRTLHPSEWSLLEGFTFSLQAICDATALQPDIVSSVLEAFVCPDDGNTTFIALNEFNATNACPIIRAPDGRFILFQYVSLTEALYESPYYWMFADKAYKSTAALNRGVFTEEFAANRLRKVFGANNVFQNVDIWKGKNKLGEIDVLVLVGNRAIVLQAKSKRLTIASRKGNDLQLQADFKGAVQDACDQALQCSVLLRDHSVRLTKMSGANISIPRAIKTIHPICLISDHFPALSFQARQFLRKIELEGVTAPLVCDVFFLDAVTEMLETPLRCLSYFELRSQAGDSILLSHEHTALGFHLNQNLWIGNADILHLSDDVSADLDVAMAVRRDGVDGVRTPPGILTLLRDTPVSAMIDELERNINSAGIDVGFWLLKLSSEASQGLNGVINRLAREAARDGRKHDATIAIDDGSGITVHCTSESHISAALSLKDYCELRKYKQRARSWCGIVIEPGTGKLRFGIVVDRPWRTDLDLERRSSHLASGHPPATIKRFVKTGAKPTKTETGRNQPCPCGSGKKYKRCHGRH